MELYTHLNENEIRAILEQFDIHNISSFKSLIGGSENTNYLVEASGRKYVLCICEQKTERNAIELAQLLIHLEAHNFNTSKIIQSTKNELVIMSKNKPIMIKEFIEGTIQQDLSPYLLRSIGKELGRLHQIDIPEYLPTQLNYGKEQFVGIKNYAANSEFNNWLDKVIEYISPYFKLDLPRALIHSDVFWDNVIINEDETTAVIMDFEESANYYRVYDIGMTIIGICAEGEIINLEKVKHLLEGYRSEVELSEDEINSIKAFTIYAGAAMSFWRFQNFNYVKPDPKRFDHYLGLKVLADYMIELDDDYFMNLMKPI